MNVDEILEENSTEESLVEEESSVEEETSAEEETSVEIIDYDRIESIVHDANTPATFDTALNSLAVTDVIMIILAIVLGVLIVKARS